MNKNKPKKGVGKKYQTKVFYIKGFICFTLKTFDKKGEGPGELSVSPMFYNTIIVSSNQIILKKFADKNQVYNLLKE